MPNNGWRETAAFIELDDGFVLETKVVAMFAGKYRGWPRFYAPNLDGTWTIIQLDDHGVMLALAHAPSRALAQKQLDDTLKATEAWTTALTPAAKRRLAATLAAAALPPESETTTR